jgi:hypothetical protein
MSGRDGNHDGITKFPKLTEFFGKTGNLVDRQNDLQEIAKSKSEEETTQFLAGVGL